ncbi:MAG: heat-inducible transcriptional repressor HrcA, partial [Xanthomonadales bacterium]|nr:heat-inducible transcriptional repressor HrcA [Xanthomonadales bacterium]
MNQDLDARARHLLRTLVAEYIRDGRPIGSRTLSRQSGLDLSAATIRNVMADLEEAGFIQSPHTSAGRVPTDQGYRFFVDALITSEAAEAESLPQLRKILAEPHGTGEVVNQVSDLLSALTNFVGLVTVPRRDNFAFRHIDFVRISE